MKEDNESYTLVKKFAKMKVLCQTYDQMYLAVLYLMIVEKNIMTDQ